MKSLWIPFTLYLLVSLGLPWLDGTGRGQAFGHHARVVFLVAAGLAGAVGLLSRRW